MCRFIRLRGAGIAAPRSSFSTPTASGYTEINVDADLAASDEVMRHVGKRAIPQMVIDGEWFQPYAPGRGLLFDELHKRLGIPRG
jgi:hypothetical protein